MQTAFSEVIAMIRLLVRAPLCLVALGLFACGGSPPPEPAPPPAPEPQPVAEAPADPPPQEEPAKEEPPPPRKAAKDFLLEPGWDFVLSYADSDIKAKTAEECEAKSKGDENKAKACETSAEADMANDRLKFAKDDKGSWWIVLLGKQKGKEIIYTKLQVEIAAEETDKLVIKPKGKDLGKKPIKKLPGELAVEMPDEYSVILEHPDRGKLVYKVKVTGESAPKPIEEAK
jgi:hypothetical protein